MYDRPLFRRLGCLSLWNVNATFPWPFESNAWCRAACTGFIATAPLVTRQYSTPIKTPASWRKARQLNHWTEEENEIFLQGYERGLPYKEILEKLPGRTVTALYKRVKYLKLAPRAGLWTTEEEQILAQSLKEGLTYVAIASRLPGRSMGACMHRAALRDFTVKTAWTTEEDKIIAQGRTEGLTSAAIARTLPGRSTIACKTRRGTLGLAGRSMCIWRTEEDDIIVHGLTEGLTYTQIAQKLPRRTPSACQTRASRLKTRKLRQEEGGTGEGG